MRAVALLADAVEDRSLGRCEAIDDRRRCSSRAEALHHRLPRSRARIGDEHLLDLAGDADNLAHLCRPHHDYAHAHPPAASDLELVGLFGSMLETRVGLYVYGSVTLIDDGGLRYVGPSVEYLERVPTLVVR